jgi:hypothetical protein
MFQLGLVEYPTAKYFNCNHDLFYKG